jgi:endonuclease/exonuclease/phosphatase family metal-dependent hydrolase
MEHFSVIAWNVGGAKVFDLPDETEKQQFHDELNDELRQLIRLHRRPYCITFQEIVEYNEPGEPRQNIIKPPEGYVYHPTILVDSNRHPYVGKWRNVELKGQWPSGSYFGQGNGILWRKDLPHFPVWSLPKRGATPDGLSHVEEVILMSGLYLGDRNTEPRAALVAHFTLDNGFAEGQNFTKPLDVFIVNLHLTTLIREREGIPKIDEEASLIRLSQLDIILYGIVSRYNEWRQGGYRFRGERRDPQPSEDFDRHYPIWILCGDFNFTPESIEYAKIKRMNFIDLCPSKGWGTKGSGFGSQATITCDYIFAGPKFVSLDAVITDEGIKGNPMPDYRIKVSDHYPLFAGVPLSNI